MSREMYLYFVILLLSINGKVISEKNTHLNEEEEQKLLGEEVLGVLGISPPSRISHYPSLSNSALEFLMEVYEDINEDSPSSTNERSFRSARSSKDILTDKDVMDIEDCNNVMTFLPKGNQQMGSMTELSFNILGVPKELTLNKAELKIYKGFPSNIQHSKDVFQISVFLQSDKGYDEKFLIDRINVKSTYNGWLEINVTNALLKWISNRKGNFELNIKVNILDDEVLSAEDVGLVDTFGEELYKPFMMGCFNGPEVVAPIKNHRPKRSLRYSSIAQRFHMPKSCQRLNFTVNFKQLGWTWIIAPEKFEAYFCSGECNFPLGAAVNPTNHAIVQTLMHLRHPHIPRPHCAPTKLTSISVVYYLSDYIVNHKIFRQIVAESCGCQ